MSSLKRVFFKQAELQNGQLLVQGDPYHHLFRVCRLQTGAKLILVDEAYREYIGTVITVSAETACVQLPDEALLPPDTSLLKAAPFSIYMALAVLKGPAMDLALQKACELGVSRIIPLQLARTVVHLDASKAATRQSRWQSIATAAAKQAGLRQVPLVEPLLSLPVFLQSWAQRSDQADLALFANEHEKQQTLKPLEARIQSASALWALTGPEGGLAQQDTDLLRAAGWESISLGDTILKADTAPVVFLTLLKYIASERPKSEKF